MAQDSQIIVQLENFRSFRGSRYEIEIAPLTILVGENSSGKSSLLAAISAALNGSKPQPQFLDGEPFFLSTPKTQVSEGAKEMILGSKRIISGIVYESQATFSLNRDFWNSSNYSMRIDESILVRVERSARKSGRDLVMGSIDGQSVVSTSVLGVSPSSLFSQLIRTRSRYTSRILENRTEQLTRAFRAAQSFRALAFSPIRSSPQRVYEGGTISRKTTGDHIPNLLDSLLHSRSRKSVTLRGQLLNFAKTAGLFTSAKTKGFDTPAGRRFSLILGIGETQQTIQDVGYGVSQALPIVGELLLSPAANCYLVQQPEVHLHPKSQAALASFFVQFVNDSDSHLVVETHSDYIVDRVRVEIKKENIAPRDVALYFLELKEGCTHIRRIDIDEIGNLVDPPPSFRSFFLQEQMELLDLA